jgi:transcriptional regulator with XRE-family HTH domain
VSPGCRAPVVAQKASPGHSGLTATHGVQMSVLIQKWRLKKGWSQQQLADLSGLSARTIQRLEAGQPAGVETLKSLAAVFEVDFHTLQPEKPDMSASSTATLSALPLDTRLEAEAFQYVRDLRRFYGHLLQFVVINALFLVGNYLLDPGHMVAWIVTLCWGSGLLVHGLRVYRFDGQWERRQVERRLGRPL